MRTAIKGLRGVAVAAIVAVLVQGLGTLTLGPAADAEIANVTATTAVNIRSAPSATSTRLGVLQAGQSLPSSGSANGWTTVTYTGRTAYVARPCSLPASPTQPANQAPCGKPSITAGRCTKRRPPIHGTPCRTAAGMSRPCQSGPLSADLRRTGFSAA